jgi:hypothetical protein
VARGIGAFILFFVVYTIVGSIVGVLLVYIPASTFLNVPPEGSMLDRVLGMGAAVVSGFVGVILGSIALNSIMKVYPGRGIGIAFVLWLVANYAVHFIFFPERTDYGTYYGLVQSLVACGTTWLVFRLPPLGASQSNGV